MLIIPAIDLKGGQCVRLKQGRMEDTTVFSADPLKTAERWFEAGARRLHIVDLDGAFEGRPVNAEIIHQITQHFPDFPVQLGGGIRSLDTIQSYLDAGIEYAIIGTKAVEFPDFVAEACHKFPQHICVGLDAKNGYVATKGWTEISQIKATKLAAQFAGDGVSSIIYTDIQRDGMMQGVNVEATIQLAQATSIPVIASGGITNMQDIEALCAESTPLLGAITGRAIYEGTLNFAEAQALADASL